MTLCNWIIPIISNTSGENIAYLHLYVFKNVAWNDRSPEIYQDSFVVW